LRQAARVRHGGALAGAGVGEVHRGFAGRGAAEQPVEGVVGEDRVSSYRTGWGIFLHG
jgi:hypothetical protein